MRIQGEKRQHNHNSASSSSFGVSPFATPCELEDFSRDTCASAANYVNSCQLHVYFSLRSVSLGRVLLFKNFSLLRCKIILDVLARSVPFYSALNLSVLLCVSCSDTACLLCCSANWTCFYLSELCKTSPGNAIRLI